MLAVERGRFVELRRGTRVAPRVLAPDRATFVPTQAGPLAGDHDVAFVRVGEGTELTIEPVAATVALPGPAVTRLELEVEVGDGARLVLEDAPLVVAEGADVVRTVRVRLGAGAALWLRDIVVLGRAGEGPGRLRSELRVEGPDGVLLHDALRIEPAAEDAYVALAPGHRAVGTVVALGVVAASGGSAAAGARGAAPAAASGGGAATSARGAATAATAASAGAAAEAATAAGGEPLEYGGRLWRVSAASAADVDAQLPAVR